MPQFEPPNDAEQAWIASNVARAAALANKYGGEPEAALPSLAALDRVWAIFSASLRQGGDDPKPIINLVGLALGHHFVAELGFAWVVATDEQGSEIAVLGQPGNILVYPTAVIAKRWQTGETAFIAALFAKMRGDIEQLRTPRG